jgi:hypothetical protein
MGGKGDSGTEETAVRKTTWLSVVLALVALGGPGAGEVQVWVAPGGSDGNPGTKERPLASLAGAREAVRALRVGGELPGPVTVLVRAGTYYLPEPLTLGPEDSGTEQAPVTWRAAPGEAVTLSGGRVVDGGSWIVDRASSSAGNGGRGQIWKAHLEEVAAGKWDFRELFVNGKRQSRARYPNFDPKNPYKGGWLFARTPPGWKGDFGRGVHNTQVAGTWMEYKINVPAAGHYYVWFRDAYVASVNRTYHNIGDMSGATELSVDGGAGVPLMNLPDTHDWGNHQWCTTVSAELDLTAGEHVLRWTNVKGGGINPDAWVFTDDAAWKPALPLPPVAEGKHLFVVQAEVPDKTNGALLFFENFFASDDTIYADPGVIKPSWGAPEAVVHIFPYLSWFNENLAVREVDAAANRLVLAKRAEGQVMGGNRWWIENVREELDSPGEWYLDREKGDLYYWPSDEAFGQVTVTAPALDRLIVIAGTQERPARFLNVQGFTIKDVDYGDEQDVYYPAHAAIHLREASDCRVEGCNFLSVGGYAVWIKGASARNVIASNEVADAGEGGVFVDGSAWREGSEGRDFHKPDPQGRRPTGNLITENWIHHCGLIYAHVAGVYINHAVSNRVTHNLVTDMPRYGLSIKYASPGNELEYNKILRTNLETNDTGGIETYDNQGPTLIRYNLVGDTIGLKPTPTGEIVSPTYTCGVYLDGNSSRAEVRGNILYRQAWSGLTLNSGHDNLIENNLFVDSRDQQFFWSNYTGDSKGNRFRRNILAWSNPESKLGLEGIPGPEWVDSDYNLYWPPLPHPLAPSASRERGERLDLSGLVKKGLDVHSVVGDPLFVDAKHDDYRLKPESPAWALGFRRLPVERMGPEGRFKGK